MIATETPVKRACNIDWFLKRRKKRTKSLDESTRLVVTYNLSRRSAGGKRGNKKTAASGEPRSVAIQNNTDLQCVFFPPSFSGIEQPPRKGFLLFL